MTSAFSAKAVAIYSVTNVLFRLLSNNLKKIIVLSQGKLDRKKLLFLQNGAMCYSNVKEFT